MLHYRQINVKRQLEFPCLLPLPSGLAAQGGAGSPESEPA